MPALVELRNATKSYRTELVETQALRGIDLTIHEGDYLAITGRSGCGKSTLLNALGLLDPVSSGTHRFRGEDALTLTFDQRASVRNRNIGFVFQSFNLLDELSVLENVRLPQSYASAPAVGGPSAEDLLERVGLGHRKNHRPSQLSGGQQQRVAIARALVMNPSLLLLDEPTGNLDEQTSQEVMDLLDEINDRQIAIVLVTHEAEFASRAKRTLRLSDGQFEKCMEAVA